MTIPPVLQTDHDNLIRRLSRLVEVSVTLNSTLDPNKLLKFIIDTAADLLECEAASVLLYNEKRGELFFATATGSDPNKLAQIPVPIDSSIAGTIFRENKPLVINDAQQDPRHYQQVGESVHFQTRMLLGVPMRIKNKVTGVLEALNKRTGAFDETDIRLLSVIADLAAVAIHNASLMHELQKAYDEISRVEKIKSDFIAIASHELRTPLGVVLGYAEFLKEETHGEVSELADRVLNSAIKLRVLVEDMTNMNLMHLGTTRLELHPVTIQSVLQAARDEIANTAQAKEQELDIKLPEQPLMVKADPEKLPLVFNNVLNNAVRFTPEGGKIQVLVTPEHNDVRVEIRDNGIGIPPKELDHIFEEFYQVEDHMRRRHGGMGLGLSIAQGIVRLHGGKIWAESKGDGQGTTIVVLIPRV
jgi:signal transduction histidine kinase